MFVGKARAYQVKHLSGAPIYSRLLALPANIWLDWKGLPGTNTLVSILQNFVNYRQNKFYNIGPCQFIFACNKPFRFVLWKKFFSRLWMVYLTKCVIFLVWKKGSFLKTFCQKCLWFCAVILTCPLALATLGYAPVAPDRLVWLDTNRVISFCVVLPKVAKEKYCTVCCVQMSTAVLEINFAKVKQHFLQIFVKFDLLAVAPLTPEKELYKVI